MTTIGVVFPAHAGMSPCQIGTLRAGRRFPRTRGDEPKNIQLIVFAVMFSPHTRG